MSTITIRRKALDRTERVIPEGRYEDVRLTAHNVRGNGQVGFGFLIPNQGTVWQNVSLASDVGQEILASTLKALGVDLDDLFEEDAEGDEEAQMDLDHALRKAKATEQALTVYVKHRVTPERTFVNVSSVFPFDGESEAETPETLEEPV